MRLFLGVSFDHGQQAIQLKFWLQAWKSRHCIFWKELICFRSLHWLQACLVYPNLTSVTLQRWLWSWMSRYSLTLVDSCFGGWECTWVQLILYLLMIKFSIALHPRVCAKTEAGFGGAGTWLMPRKGSSMYDSICEVVFGRLCCATWCELGRNEWLRNDPLVSSVCPFVRATEC